MFSVSKLVSLTQKSNWYRSIVPIANRCYIGDIDPTLILRTQYHCCRSTDYSYIPIPLYRLWDYSVVYMNYILTYLNPIACCLSQCPPVTLFTRICVILLCQTDGQTSKYSSDLSWFCLLMMHFLNKFQ